MSLFSPSYATTLALQTEVQVIKDNQDFTVIFIYQLLPS